MAMIRSIRRRFSISAPRLAVRPHIPWYVRWALVVPVVIVVVLVVGAAYDSGLELAGFHRGKAEKELSELRERVAFLESENAKLSNQVATYERQGQIDEASTQGIEAQLKNLHDENARLQEDLMFFQNLPLTGSREAELSIHRLKVDAEGLPGEYHCRMLLVQSVQQRGKAFEGKMQLVVSGEGEQDGQKVVIQFPQENSPQDVASYQLSFKYYQRVDRVFKLPPDMKVDTVQVRVFEKGMQEPKVQQTVSLSSQS